MILFEKSYSTFRITILIGMVLFFYYSLLPPDANAEATDENRVIMIVHSSVDINEISRIEIKNIFTGKTKLWPNGDKIFIAYSQQKETQFFFFRNYIKKSPQQFINFWRNLIFTGKAISIPKGIEDENELMQYVSQKKGCIGYITPQQLIDGIKIVSVK